MSIFLNQTSFYTQTQYTSGIRSIINVAMSEETLMPFYVSKINIKFDVFECIHLPIYHLLF